ncbi:MAG: ABC transporter permease [Lachnospiraceae bacterium]|nr:ABC transporter permease [Lachnospiraceae bacterium]
MINTAKEIMKDHWRYRKQIWKLALNDMKKEYKGAMLGPAWILAKPAIRIFVYYFAFAIGLRQGSPVEGFPKFLWLLCGLVPWFYMQNMIPGGSSALRRYTYLITKIKYPISTIPTFVNLSFFLVHCLLEVVVICIFTAMGYPPDIYLLQLPLYMLMLFLFSNMWGLFAGMLGAISRDFVNFMKSITIAFFWLSGILYDSNKIKVHWLRRVMGWNPVTIMVNGYRNCFVYKRWVWETPHAMRNFWILFFLLTLLALWTYRKTHKDIPDVL